MHAQRTRRSTTATMTPAGVRMLFLGILLAAAPGAALGGAETIGPFPVDAGLFFPGTTKRIVVPFAPLPHGRWRVVRQLAGCSCTTAGSLPESVDGGAPGGVEVDLGMGSASGQYKTSFGLELQPLAAGDPLVAWYRITGRVQHWVEPRSLKIELPGGARSALIQLDRSGRPEPWDDLSASVLSASFAARIGSVTRAGAAWAVDVACGETDIGTMRARLGIRVTRAGRAVPPDQEVVVVVERAGAYASVPRSLLVGVAGIGERLHATVRLLRDGGWDEAARRALSLDWDDKARVACELRPDAAAGPEILLTFTGAAPTGSASGELRVSGPRDRVVYHIPYLAATAGAERTAD